MSELIFVPVVLFILIVAPLWLILHYRERARHRADEQAPKGAPVTPELAAAAEKMERRITALEAILDAESPGWRQRNQREEHS